jgi:hypothetical protein
MGADSTDRITAQVLLLIQQSTSDPGAIMVMSRAPRGSIEDDREPNMAGIRGSPLGFTR